MLRFAWFAVCIVASNGNLPVAGATRADEAHLKRVKVDALQGKTNSVNLISQNAHSENAQSQNVHSQSVANVQAVHSQSVSNVQSVHSQSVANATDRETPPPPLALPVEPDLLKLGQTRFDLIEALAFVTLTSAAVFVLSSSLAAFVFADSVSSAAAASLAQPADGAVSGTNAGPAQTGAARAGVQVPTGGGWGKPWFKRHKRWGK